MKLALLAGWNDPDCRQGGTCPAVLDTEGDDVLVQGFTVDARIPDGESIVRLPRQLIVKAAWQLLRNRVARMLRLRRRQPDLDTARKLGLAS